MKEIELKGHSGCRICLAVPDEGRMYVRKTSKSNLYNERLRRQCLKQKEYKSIYACIPRVINEGLAGDLYFYDMEYVRGATLNSLIGACAVDKAKNIADFLVNLIKENKAQETGGRGNVKIIEKKIREVYDAASKRRMDRSVREAFHLLENHSWGDIKSSNSHGDLTLENVIVSNNGAYYLIDFLDSFYDTWIGDASKLLLDLLVGWSFRHNFINSDAITENIRVRVMLLGREFISRLNKLLDEEKTWKDIYAYLLLDMLRIMPYITDERVYQFTIRSLNIITEKVKEERGLYDNLNNAVCWPVYALSGH